MKRSLEFLHNLLSQTHRILRYNATHANEIKSFDSIPGPKGLPFIGASYKTRRGGELDLANSLEVNKCLHQNYGPVVKVNYGFGHVIVYISDPVDFPKVMGAEGSIPNRMLLNSLIKFRQQKNIPLGLLGNGEDWKTARSSVQKELLRPRSLTTYLPQHSRVGDDLVRVTKLLSNNNGVVEDYVDTLKRYSYEAAGIIFYDRRMGALDDTVIADSQTQRSLDAILELFENLGHLELLWGWHKFGLSKTWREFTKTAEVLYQHQARLHEDIVNTLASSSKGMADDEEDNFIRRLFKNPDLPQDNIHVLTQDLLFGGIETTAYSLAFAIFNLCKHPDVQEKLASHIKVIMGDRKAVTEDDLQQMSYLKACVKESMRLIPSASRILLRYPETDLVLKNYLIPAGTMVALSTHVSSTSQENCGRPDEFIPERWLRNEDSPEIRINKMTFHPFGHGPRSCIGQRTALQEVYVALIKLLSEFRLETMVDDLKVETPFLVIPTAPLDLKFVKRK